MNQISRLKEAMNVQSKCIFVNPILQLSCEYYIANLEKKVLDSINNLLIRFMAICIIR